jgi:hypothetical protein
MFRSAIMKLVMTYVEDSMKINIPERVTPYVLSRYYKNNSLTVVIKLMITLSDHIKRLLLYFFRQYVI